MDAVKNEINRREQAFREATVMQKRVLIAVDTIKQIKSGRFEPQTGFFASIDFKQSVGDRDSIREQLLANNATSCSCCALGAMMLSCTLFNNKQVVGDTKTFTYLGDAIFSKRTKTNTPSVKNGFDKIFTKKMLAKIECAFEGRRGFIANASLRNFSIKLTRSEVEKYYAFRPLYLSNLNRLVAIMKNIIDHGGNFECDKEWIKLNTESFIESYLQFS